MVDGISLQDLEHKSFHDSFLVAMKEGNTDVFHFPLTEASDKQIKDAFGDKSKEAVNGFGSPVDGDEKKNR